MRWAQRQRMFFIRDRLASHGRINRADLIAEFEISKPQTAIDFRKFQSEYPGAMTYDQTMKAYVPGVAK